MEVKLQHIIGVIIIALNLWWIWEQVESYYFYHYTNLMFIIMFPDWVLFTRALLGTIGIILGLKVLRQTISIKAGILIQVGIFILGTLVNMFYWEIQELFS